MQRVLEAHSMANRNRLVICPGNPFPKSCPTGQLRLHSQRDFTENIYLPPRQQTEPTEYMIISIPIKVTLELEDPYWKRYRVDAVINADNILSFPYVLK